MMMMMMIDDDDNNDDDDDDGDDETSSKGPKNTSFSPRSTRMVPDKKRISYAAVFCFPKVPAPPMQLKPTSAKTPREQHLFSCPRDGGTRRL